MIAKAISPDEAMAAKKSSIPAEVISAFNELIKQNISASGHATIKQQKVVAFIVARMGLKSSKIIFDNKWLDVEDIYRAKGWKVKYDKPGYNEDYEAYFEFSK